MLVSIIIPCYNVSDYIEECVDSCYNQTYNNIEVICIDNNSKDDTFLKLKFLKNKYPNLILDKEEKAGAPYARNKGLELASGDWVQFLDADDLLLPNKIKHQIDLIISEVSFIAGACIKQDINLNKVIILPLQDDIYKAMFTTTLGNTCSNLWNRKVLLEIGGWTEALQSSQEADLMFRIIKNKGVVILDNEPLTIIRERESGQISQRNPVDKWILLFEVRIKMQKWLKEEKQNYYFENKSFYDNCLFGILRILSKFDFKSAEKLFNQHFDKYFKIIKNQNHSTIIYRYIFNIFGFKCAEKFRKLFKPKFN